MRVDWVSLVNFRSYPELEWHPDPGVNLLIGPNGAGKTNLLEAVSYLATLKSFRSVPDSAVIADEQETAVIRAGLSGPERERLIEIEIPRRGARRTQVDKTRLKRTADLLGVLRVVAFLPEDLDLVKRGPAYRRELLDDIAVQLWPSAYLDQSEYERALRQRNAFLKQGHHDDATLSVWDSRLAQAGGRVIARRSRVVETLAPMLETSYREVAESNVAAGFTYDPTWPGDLDQASAAEFGTRLVEALERSRRVDYERRMTTVGPHRDEPGFAIDGYEARVHGSQGEQRTMALAVKLAAHRAVAGAVGETPVLLLDDVFSELDPNRADALARALPEGTQTLITSARPEDIPVAGSTWRVGDGVTR
ncbi:MAG TPA: DNA replication/repair protein RecF [Acidimicrobiia bacterium]|nr:DNA replication/repair protein RecF [Acidimicrobiia bacterium]